MAVDVSSLRDRLLANDPAFSRLRTGLRVTLSVCLSVGLLAALHMLWFPLPKAAYALAITLSIQSGLSVKDATMRDQFVTRLLGCGVCLGVVALAALLEGTRSVSDLVFLVLIFVATCARAFGPRGFALGMFAFMSFFIGAYLKPALGDLPLVAIGPLTALLVGQGVRRFVLADDWRVDLGRAVAAVETRVDRILSQISATAGGIEDRHLRTMARGMEGPMDGQVERLKDAVLMAESFVPARPETDGRHDAERDDPRRSAVTVCLFELHVAAESLVVLSRQAVPPARLVAALRGGTRETVERLARKAMRAAADDVTLQETVDACLSLDAVRRRLAVAVSQLVSAPDISLSAKPGPVNAGAATWPDVSLANPAVRSAIQITLASAIAMVFGLMLSRERWFWAVLSAFLVFTNTRSRGDTAMRAVQRSVGTFFGITVGLVAASLLQTMTPVILSLAALCVFLAFYLLAVSYAAMTFFVSIVLALVYSLIGSLTLDVLVLRLEETMIGSFAGLVVAFLVFPARTEALAGEALGRWCAALRRLLTDAAEGRSSFDLIHRSQALERAYAELSSVVRPLGSSWQLVTRPGVVRQTLMTLMAATYWARTFAGGLAAAGGPEGETGGDRLRSGRMAPLVAEALAAVDRIEAKGGALFLTRRTSLPRKRRHFRLSRQSSLVGLEMIARTLSRLEPAPQAGDAPQTPPRDGPGTHQESPA
ncbi:putative membrane protein YccC [Rhizobium sp. PP-F2F-G48]|uniref:FUSC family protein n=1 Tax=Rhizobium sp. PP-F2F-G48 TaxID=2135651 RepID=UPI00104784D2|nr:FUSC family protein [Rhizobium sp. PP-F2F-G48]TCM58921.1 putative membrane protein YccC [Rhizobium sp. PP-F2F-G48]